MNLNFYRKEALEAQQRASAGMIVMRRPVPIRVAGWVAVVIGVLLTTFIVCGHYTRKAHVTGRIAPAAGAIQAVALLGGHIVQVHVRDGASVRAGQALFDISTERNGDNGGIDSRIDASLEERRR